MVEREHPTAPVLTTTRLRLRPIVYQDFNGYVRLMASDRSRWMGGPAGADKAWAYLCFDVAQWSLSGYGGLMIELRATGETMGQVCIGKGPFFPEVELGWFLFEGFEGRGYATEAASRMRDWGFGERGLETLVSYIDPANKASIAVARRLGAVLDAGARPNGPNDLVFRHPRTA
jgi:RimJ/RimL family protein N-acetyltransferase